MQGIAINALCLQSHLEAQETNGDATPSEERRNCVDSEEPFKHLGCAFGYGHVSQATPYGRETDGIEWNSIFVAFEEDARSLPVLGQAKKVPRAHEKESIRGR